MPNTELLGHVPWKIAMMEITTTVTRAIVMAVFSEIFTLKKPRSRFWDTLEDAARSWESAVDIVAAKIPARMMPATNAANMPCWLKRSAIRTMMVSDMEPSRKRNGACFCHGIANDTDADCDSHGDDNPDGCHTTDSVSFSLSSMAMKRRRI